jgi:hypothetical protein
MIGAETEEGKDEEDQLSLQMEIEEIKPKIETGVCELPDLQYPDWSGEHFMPHETDQS